MKDPSFDPLDLTLLPGMKGVLQPAESKPPRHGPGEKFILGPLPWNWIRRAAPLPGRAMAVAMLIWREAGIQGARCPKLCLRWAAELGLDRQAARRGLEFLEDAGLIRTTRRSGRCIDVEILNAPAAAKFTTTNPKGACEVVRKPDSAPPLNNRRTLKETAI